MHSRNSNPAEFQPAQQFGGPLTLPPDAATDLPTALQRAIERWPARGVTHLDGDLAAHVQTYHELATEASRILTSLGEAGLGEGDFVLLQLAASTDYLPTLWACLLGGIVPVSLAVPPKYDASTGAAQRVCEVWELLDRPTLVGNAAAQSDLAELLGANEAVGSRLLAVERLRHAFPAKVWHRPQADDTALMLVTSGSTGGAKVVPLSHGNVISMFAGTSTALELSSEERFLNWLPLDHVGATVPMHLMPVWLGADQFHVPAAGLLHDILHWFELVDRHRISFTWAPNFAYGLVVGRADDLAGRAWDLSSLRILVNAGEAVAPATAQQFWQLVAPFGLAAGTIRPSFGMTECASAITWSDRYALDTPAAESSAPRFADLGPPIAGAGIRVIDESGKVVAQGAEGEIQLRGPTLFAGYYRQPELNQSVFSDGWFHTGDLGYLDTGRLFVTGRKKDQITVNGVHYPSEAIEKAVESACPVERSFTAACPVRRAGRDTDAIAIFCVPTTTANVDPSELIRSVRQQVQQQLGVNVEYILPVAHEEIPKTSIGKIQRRQLKQRFERGEFDSRLEALRNTAQRGSPPSAARRVGAGEWERRLSELLKSVLRLEQIAPTANLFDLGATSVQLVQIEGRLRDELNLHVTTADVLAHPSIRMLAQFVSTGQVASETSESSAAMPQPVERSAERRVAVVGMSARFPGAPDVDRYWSNVRDGVESIARFTDDELIAAGVDPRRLADPRYVKAAPMLAEHDCFDAEFFGISDEEAALLDPQHRLFLQCAWHVLEHAGYDPDRVAGRVGVFVSVGFNTYVARCATYPDLGSDFTQLLTASAPDALPTRVSYKLNLRGPSMAVQTACSGGLAAVHLARQALLDGECEMALAGGVSIWVPETAGYRYHEGGLHSSDGHCRAFDVGADGMVFGNGVGAVLLKRLDQAEAHGDTIHAVLLGSAINNDGAAKAGYTAVGLHGQSAAIRQAHQDAGVAPDSIGYLECHGTGTVLGDAIELNSLTKAFEQGTRRRGFCAVGSVKTNIGHMGPACGLAGLIKTIEALKHRQLPPTLHCDEPNRQIRFEDSPFYVNPRLRPWPSQDGVRRAGVNSFGIGGTNVHMVVEEASPAARVRAPRSEQLLLVSARTEHGLQQAAEQLAAFLDRHDDLRLDDVAYTLQVGRRPFEHRRVVVCSDLAAARAALRGDASNRAASFSPAASPPSLVQRWGRFDDRWFALGRELYAEEPVFRTSIDEASEFVQTISSVDVRGLIDPADGRGEDGSAIFAGEVADQRIVQFAVGLALSRLLQHWDITPQAVVGEGVGRYVAAVVAGLVSWQDAAKLVLDGDASRQSLEYAANESSTTYLCPATGKPWSSQQAANPPAWLTEADDEARVDAWWLDFLEQGDRIGLVLGGETNGAGSQLELSGAAGQLSPAVSLPPQSTERARLLACVGQLWLSGISIDWEAHQAGRGCGRVPLPTYRFERRRHWLEPVTTPAATLVRGAGTVDWRAAPEPPLPRQAEQGLLAGWIDEQRLELERQLASALQGEWVGVLARHIHEVLHRLLGPAAPASIPHGAPLRDLGLTSVTATNLVAALRSTTGCELPTTLFFDCPTIREVAENVATRLVPRPAE